MTTKLQAQRMLHRVGLDVEFVRTGHPDWVRGFIKKNGVSYGRMSFLHGELNSTKWYSHHGIEFEVFCLDMLIGFDYMPSREEYALTWYWAEKEAQLHYSYKVKLRSQLPPKKRPALAAPNKHRWFRQIFIYKWIVFRSDNCEQA